MNQGKYITKEFVIYPSAGKRLIAKSLLHIPAIIDALENRTIVIIAGTTNGYAAEEFLKKINQEEEFSKKRFFRGITLPPKYKTTDTGRISDESSFIGDVVIIKGKWEKGATIFDVADQLQKGDIILKGANAVNLEAMQAAVLIGHPKAGTIIPILQSVAGKRVELYIPVGLEKRVSADINAVTRKLNSPNASGFRYMPVTGNIITELQAINLITGADAELIAAGGVCGAEGACWVAVSGTEEQIAAVDDLYESVKNEPSFQL
jgi:hypothetical protein